MSALPEERHADGQRVPAVARVATSKPFPVVTEMAPRTHDERIAEILEQQSVLLLRMDSRLMAQQSGDKTSLPNWLMPLICTAFIGLVVYAFTAVVQNLSKENEKLERRIDLQETYMKNTREQLIAHGWVIDDQGNIKATTAKK